MSKRVRLEFTQPPGGLTEVIQQAAGVVQSAAYKVAARASSLSPSHASYDVTMETIKFAQDSAYGVSRPAAVISTTDTEAYKEDAKEKTLAKAVGKV